MKSKSYTDLELFLKSNDKNEQEIIYKNTLILKGKSSYYINPILNKFHYSNLWKNRNIYDRKFID